MAFNKYDNLPYRVVARTGNSVWEIAGTTMF
jgi:hypothetical protein